MGTPAVGGALERKRIVRFVGWLLPANAIFLCVIALRYLSFSALTDDSLARLFLLLILPSHFLALGLVLSPAVLVPALVWPGRWVVGLATAAYGILAMAVFVDTQVFALYRFHLNGMVIGLLTSGVAGEILPISATTLLRSSSIFAALVAVEAALSAWIWRVVGRQARLHGAPIGALLAGVALAGHGLHAWADVARYTPVTRQARILPWVRPLTAYGLSERRGWIPEYAAANIPVVDSALAYPRAPLHCSAGAERPLNVLLVAIEEWRFDEFDPVTTPNIFRLAHGSTRFLEHFSSGNSSRYGIFGLLYGLHGTYWDLALAEERGPVLIDEAIRSGYRFGIYASASLLHPEFDRTAFRALRDRIALHTPGATAHERDRAITDAALELIASDDPRPFFAFLFYDSPHALDYPDDLAVPHAPALAELDHLALGPGFDPLPLRNRHANAVYYVDGLVSELIASLESRSLLEDTAVVITGDHGEEFDDTGANYWGHNSNFSRYQTQVPLVLQLPGRRGGEVRRLTSHVDVAPTLMEEALRCRAPARDYANGRSLLDPSPRTHAVVASRSLGMGIVQGERILLLARIGGARVVDRELREVPGADVDPELVRSVLLETAAFRAEAAAVARPSPESAHR